MEGEGGSVRVEKVSNKAEKEVRLKGRKGLMKEMHERK